MAENQNQPSSSSQRPSTLIEERGLQPAKNPPPMPQVKPPAQEKRN
jgi:hypothetical protein